MPERYRVGATALAVTILLLAAIAPKAGVVSTRVSQEPAEVGHRFVAHTIATGLTGGYQPVVVDLNRDGRPDVIGLSVSLDELAWFENPGWRKHVLTTGLNRAINLAPRDLDSDGVPELVVAHAFGTSHASSQGVLSLLTHQGDPTQPWQVREIDRTPTVHRIRWGDIDGTGRHVLVTAPLVGASASAPDYRDTVPIFWYRPGDWLRRIVTESEQGVVHGLLVKPWLDPGRDAVFSASFAGVHVHRFLDGRWIRSRMIRGDPAPWPRSGASEVEIGHLGTLAFIATIEPWHGDQVVVYREDDESWTRGVIDTIDSGHTIVAADFDGDGSDEIVTGDRGDTRSLYLYSAQDADGAAWSRQILDDGDMSASGCVVADLDDDGRLDLVCIGGGTANVKWYQNLAP